MRSLAQLPAEQRSQLRQQVSAGTIEAAGGHSHTQYEQERALAQQQLIKQPQQQIVVLQQVSTQLHIAVKEDVRIAGLQQQLLAQQQAGAQTLRQDQIAVLVQQLSAQQQVVAQQGTLIAGMQQQLEVVTQRQLSAYMHHRLWGAVIWGGFQVCFRNDV
jgi:hypothetical protein